MPRLAPCIVIIEIISLVGILLLDNGFPGVMKSTAPKTHPAAEKGISIELQLERIGNELKDTRGVLTRQVHHIEEVRVSCWKLEEEIHLLRGRDREISQKVNYLSNAYEATGLGARLVVFRGRVVRPEKTGAELRSAMSRHRELRRLKTKKVRLLAQKRQTLNRAQRSLSALEEQCDKLELAQEACRANIDHKRTERIVQSFPDLKVG